MINVTFQYDLYGIYERIWESCLIDVTASLSEEVASRMANLEDDLDDIGVEDVKFVSAKFTDKPTISFMMRARADWDRIIEDVRCHFVKNPHDLFEYVTEHLFAEAEARAD